MGRSILNVSSNILWAGVQDWIKTEKVGWVRVVISLWFLTADAAAATTSSSRRMHPSTVIQRKALLLSGILSQSLEKKLIQIPAWISFSHTLPFSGASNFPNILAMELYNFKYNLLEDTTINKKSQLCRLGYEQPKDRSLGFLLGFSSTDENNCTRIWLDSIENPKGSEWWHCWVAQCGWECLWQSFPSLPLLHWPISKLQAQTGPAAPGLTLGTAGLFPRLSPASTTHHLSYLKSS